MITCFCRVKDDGNLRLKAIDTAVSNLKSRCVSHSEAHCAYICAHTETSLRCILSEDVMEN